MAKCPVCQLEQKNESKLFIDSPWSVFFRPIECMNCGKFLLEQNAVYALEEGRYNLKQRALLSHNISKRQKKDWTWEIQIKEIEDSLYSSKLPSVTELAENIIFWIGEQSSGFGAEVNFNVSHALAKVGAIDDTGFVKVLDHLKKDGLIVSDYVVWGDTLTFSLSFRGWQKYEELQRGKTDSRTAFMAMKFGNPLCDDFYKIKLKSAVEETGFSLHRLDESPKAGLIDDHLRVSIRNARFLIVDLTEQNNGAYWEAGFAEGLGKPVIYTCHEEHYKDIHFDTNHLLTIKWHPEKYEMAIRNVKATIRNTFPSEAIMEVDD